MIISHFFFVFITKETIECFLKIIYIDKSILLKQKEQDTLKSYKTQ